MIYEPHALVWILMPETIQGLWKQRLRWAMGGAQVLLKNLDVCIRPRQRRLWLLMAEVFLTLIWAYAVLILVVFWMINFTLWGAAIHHYDLPLLPESSGLVLGITCMIQFAVSLWLDSQYDRGLGRNYYWLIWYPFVFWIIIVLTTIIAFPKVLMRSAGQRARWVSPDRGI
ncbi:hypothetical protein [Neosynechococcus sphagnicola]|uniref:hypothetical protein n=1 Tax=Neosynechococcus sphagnicola TaxID=1501145 RepID=UPI000AFB8C16|nr:hypothetical protein [Neosynechococcus sphagnicola]